MDEKTAAVTEQQNYLNAREWSQRKSKAEFAVALLSMGGAVSPATRDTAEAVVVEFIK